MNPARMWESLCEESDNESEDDCEILDDGPTSENPTHPACGGLFIKSMTGFVCQRCGKEIPHVHQGMVSFGQSSRGSGPSMVISGRGKNRYNKCVKTDKRASEANAIEKEFAALSRMNEASEFVKVTEKNVLRRTAEEFMNICKHVITRGEKRRATKAVVLRTMALQASEPCWFTKLDLVRFFKLKDMTRLSTAETTLKRLESNGKISIGVTKRIPETVQCRLLSRNFLEKLDLDPDVWCGFVEKSVRIFERERLHKGSVPNLKTMILSFVNVVAITKNIPGVSQTASTRDEISSPTLKSFAGLIQTNRHLFEDVFSEYGVSGPLCVKEKK